MCWFACYHDFAARDADFEEDMIISETTSIKAQVHLD